MTSNPLSISGPSRKPRSGGAPKQLAILLHGWGADGANLIDLADMFAHQLPDAFFVAPNAPYPCEANPFGYQWFSLLNRQPQHMLDGVRHAAEVVNQFIDEQLKVLSSPSPLVGEGGEGGNSPPIQTSNILHQPPLPNPPPQRGEGIKIILIGFSQGTMTALHVALHRSPAIAAVVGFSGALIAPELAQKDSVSRPPACLVHGEADEVVPFAALKQATDTLKNCGVAVESHPRPFLGHSIDMDGIKIAAEFIRRIV